MTSERPISEGLGASELAAIAGSSPWQTATGVWLTRMQLADRPDTRAMSTGRRLERPILQMAADQTGVRITHNRQTFRHPDWPDVPLFATPDGFTAHRHGLVEIKMVGHRYSDWQDGPPDYVGLQVQGQLACLPRTSEAIVAALVGSDLRIFRVQRDPVVQAALPGLVSEWWQRHIVDGRSPEPVGPDDQWALLRMAAAAGGRAERIASTAEANVAEQLIELLAAQETIGNQIEEKRMALAQAALTEDLTGSGWRARWGSRSTVDWHAICEEQGIADVVVRRHTKTSPTFTFRRTAKTKPKTDDDDVRVEVVSFVRHDDRYDPAKVEAALADLQGTS